MTFHGSEFGRLVFGDFVCAAVADKKLKKGEYCRYGKSNFKCWPGDLPVFFMDNIPGVRLEYETGSGKDSSYPYVQHTIYAGGVEPHGPEIGDLGPGIHSFADDVITCGCLLPGVGHYYPDGRKERAKKNHDSRKKMYPWSYPIPAENKYSKKAGLQCESKDPFCRKCAAEDIAHIFRISSPVSTELKLHDDACGDTYTKDEGEYAYPEPDGHSVDLVAGPEV